MSKLPALAGQVREQLRKYLHYRAATGCPTGIIDPYAFPMLRDTFIKPQAAPLRSI
jgi:hypothetical protein